MIKSEKGIGLIEVLIALAILGLVAAAFLSGLATASKALIVADERTTAESLARSQMEYVKSQDYSNTNVDWDYTVTDSGRSFTTQPPDWWVDANPGNPPLLASNYAGYSVEASADEDAANVDIQKITVEVYYEHDDSSDPVIKLEGYKVDRP